MLFHVLDTVGNMNLSDGRCFLSVEEHNEPPLFSSERLMGAVGPRDSTTGGGSLSRQPGLRQHPALHAQPRTPGEPLSVPLPQPRLLHRHGVQQPALHPPLPGGRSLSLLNHQQQLPSPLRLLLLPFLHEQPRQWPGVQDGDRGGVWQPHQPPSKWGGSLLLGERGRGKLVVFLRDQKGVLRWRFDETFEAERMESVTLPLLTLASWAQQLALDTAERVCSQWPTVWVWQTKVCMFPPVRWKTPTSLYEYECWMTSWSMNTCRYHCDSGTHDACLKAVNALGYLCKDFSPVALIYRKLLVLSSCRITTGTESSRDVSINTWTTRYSGAELESLGHVECLLSHFL